MNATHCCLWRFWMVIVGATLAGAAPASAAAVTRGRCPENLPDGQILASVPIPAEVRTSGVLRARVNGREPVVAQVEPADTSGGTPDRAWLILPPCRAGEPLEIEWIAAPAATSQPAAFETAVAGPMLSIRGRGADAPTLLGFHHGEPTPGGRLPLTDYIHPLLGMDGEALTALSPGDHIHHRGIFWAWVRHDRHGKSIGSWWIPNQIHLESGELEHADGPLFSRFAARHYWVSTAEPVGGKRFVDEYVVCRYFRETPIGRAVDIEITLTALLDGIRIGGTLELQKGYGGLTVRYNNPAQVELVMDGKKMSEDANQLHARWADLNGFFAEAKGSLRERRSGAAVFVSPDHPDNPPPWIIRGPSAASKGGSYAVLNVAYPGMEMLDLPKGKPLHLRYRIWIHRGDTQEGRVEESFRIYTADFNWELVG